MTDSLPDDGAVDRAADHRRSAPDEGGSPAADETSRPGSAPGTPDSSAGSPEDDATTAGDHRVDRRAADLLPEEQAAGSADPEAQAAAILAESDEREGDLEASPSSFLEHRTSGETMPSGEATR